MSHGNLPDRTADAACHSCRSSNKTVLDSATALLVDVDAIIPGAASS
jgi:hypothetical protein